MEKIFKVSLLNQDKCLSFLFSLYLLYDTKVLQVKAENCQNMIKNFNQYPNYPRESLSIFLDILNLFTNIGRINSSQ